MIYTAYSTPDSTTFQKVVESSPKSEKFDTFLVLPKPSIN